MIKKMCFFATSLLLSLTALVNAYQLQIPERFYVKERWLSWTTTFDIETETAKLGYVQRRFWSLALNYDFFDNFDVLHANARKRFWSFGAIFDVTDSYERPIGSVEEKFSCFFPTFEIIAPAPRCERLCTAKLNFWGTKYTLFDPIDQHIIAVMKRPFFRLKSDWTVTLYDLHAISETHIDPRLFVVVMAFQTDMDYWQYRNGEANQLPVPMIDCSVEKQEKQALLSFVEPFKEGLEGLNPTDDEIEKVEAFAEEYLSKLEGAQSEWTKESRLRFGVKALAELFKSDELSLSEKSALYLMIKNHLSQ